LSSIFDLIAKPELLMTASGLPPVLTCDLQADSCELQVAIAKEKGSFRSQAGAKSVP